MKEYNLYLHTAEEEIPFSRCTERKSMTIRKFAPLGCLLVPSTGYSFNRTCSLREQDVRGPVFHRIQSCTTLSSGFWGKIISTVLEVFCLSWAITVRRDARDSSEALTIKSLHAVISKLRILDCWCFEQQLVQHYESNNRHQKKLKSNLKKNVFFKTWPELDSWLELDLGSNLTRATSKLLPSRKRPPFSVPRVDILLPFQVYFDGVESSRTIWSKAWKL